MAKDEAKKVVYSGTINVNNNGVEEIGQPDIHQEMRRLEDENKVMLHTLRRLEEETVLLRELFNKANGELSNIKKPALLVADLISVVEDKAVIKLPNGNKFYSFISPDISGLQSGDSVLVDQKGLNVVQRINVNAQTEVEKFVIIQKPKESWKEIGGLKKEIQEVKEVIELPLKKPELFKKVGIQPPKGVLLYGPPGTGKTLLAKAVAHSTNATFIEVVGSELVQKFIGEGAKLVKDIFALARSKAPSIVFIDELDALAATRMDTGTSGEREVNRTFMQLLSEVDGFKALDDVKIIGATNRLDILDPAIIRPGRLDRLIEVSLPDEEGREEVLKVHTRSMNLQKVNVKEIAKKMENFSGAEIRAACTEAGFFAIRDNRDHVTKDDFLQAIEKVRFEDLEDEDHQKLFG
ncbi:proteasome-activating nucleotidase [Candidatus Woesearchaeota archaeon CG10_big_fil_rev_8_21_14_0_10_45_16]|nr:MAG: proteasome-activating nucleotidase [Candidatus Woesearchaeota archaeon CG10_big_fil_rev_8_21_14_0_10_45_16]